MTAEQLEASRVERMRLNGNGALTLEDARTWIEETGLCLFLPRRQFSTSVAPSFVEAIAGHRNSNPDPKHIALAEELLVRLETDGVAVRLNLLGQPGEHPDFVVAAWVLPYVYALRGDRDWRRNPQLTGSRQVSPLAVQAYKLLEANETAIPALKHALGREVSEQAVLRAITELWQQLRIIPVIAAPGQAPKWQLLRVRYQKAIAEGASTSQVTAISVLASIFLQAVIAATMEDVELFLAPLTARSKVREVLRGLVATRQVHTISLGHAPHFYVAGTLPEFAIAPTIYASSSMPASAYFLHSHEREEETINRWGYTPAPPVVHEPVKPAAPAEPVSASVPETHAPRIPAPHKPVAAQKSSPARPHFSRPAAHSRDRKPAQASSASRTARRPSAESSSRSSARPANGSRSASRPGTGGRWSANSARSTNGARGTSGARSTNGSSNGSSRSARPAARPSNGHHTSSAQNGKPSTAGSQRNGHTAKPAGKNGTASRNGGGMLRKSTSPRKDVRTNARTSRPTRKPALSAGAKAGNSKRYGFTAPAKQRTKKRG